MNRRAAVFFIFLLLIAGNISLPAANPEDLLDNTLATALRAGEQPSAIQFKNGNLVLMPRDENLVRITENIRKNLNPGVITETLYLYEKPAGADKTGWTQSELAALYNETIALGTLAGIQYFSASRNAMRTFYESSSVIDNPSAKNPLPDPRFSVPARELIIYARQKDLTFGDNIYEYTYNYFPGALIFVQENLTNLKAGIFTAVRANNLRSVLAVMDAGEYLLVYAVSMAKAASLPGMNDRIGSSFTNRAQAILEWVTSGADRAFGKDN